MIESLILWTSFKITLASYAKQNLNLANLKYGKDNLLFITLKHTQKLF